MNETNSPTPDPIELFQEWFAHAEGTGRALPESVALATATPDGSPSARIVLLKAVDERGFVFFTNYTSRKAQEIEANPSAALCFHWAELERQVRVTGAVARISQEESDAYFQSRPRGSRIGAWASKQSQPLAARAELEDRIERYEEEFDGGAVPLPPHWGGYRIAPSVIEFWSGRPDRLHERLVFRRAGDGWQTETLYP